MNKKQDDIWGFEWEEPGAREKALAFFEDYYADFRARVPEKRRLEFSVRDGWGPLCEHLGVEVPTVVNENGERVRVPFPRTNEAEQFKAKVSKMRNAAVNEAMMDWAKNLVFMTAVGYSVYHIASPLTRFTNVLRR